MKLKSLPAIAALACGLLATSCEDSVSSLGGSLTSGEVTITVDSIETKIEAASVYTESIDGRNLTKLLGRINVPEYGVLDCSFVSQMLSASSMSIPDSITEEKIDSLRLIFSVPRGSLTGDSLSPQQLTVYELTKQLPSGITSTFNPEGYFDASSQLGRRSYTLSNIAKGDSAMKNETYVRIPVMMPKQLALDLFRKYRANDPIFQWPSSFNQWFPGIYVEQNFGNGCIANISKAEMYIYWNRINRTYDEVEEDKYEYVDHIVRDSLCLMASQPEVLSSNVINYRVSDRIRALADAGKAVLTTPGGYYVDMKFPIDRILDVYYQHGDVMSVVSSLKMQIPAETLENDYGLDVAPYLLMVKKSQREEFFNENKVPDGLNSFYATYDSDSQNYQFNSMRSYFLNILEKVRNGETVTADDTDFCLIPVMVTTETVTSYSTSTTYVTRVQPYLTKPTMTLLDMEKAIICFVYSSQEIE